MSVTFSLAMFRLLEKKSRWPHPGFVSFLVELTIYGWKEMVKHTQESVIILAGRVRVRRMDHVTQPLCSSRLYARQDANFLCCQPSLMPSASCPRKTRICIVSLSIPSDGRARGKRSEGTGAKTNPNVPIGGSLSLITRSSSQTQSLGFVSSFSSQIKLLSDETLK